MEDPEIVLCGVEPGKGAWPVRVVADRLDAKSVYGIGIRHDYRAIGPGLKATHARGRHSDGGGLSVAEPVLFSQLAEAGQIPQALDGDPTRRARSHDRDGGHPRPDL